MPRDIKLRPNLADAMSAAAASAADDFQPSERLADRLARQISRSISLGDYREGARLPTENDLAARYRVSRPVIREAFMRLRDQGLIVSRRGSGSYVRGGRMPSATVEDVRFAPIGSLAEVKKCFLFRTAIEGDAAFHAAHDRTPQSLIAMQSALKKLEMAIATGKVGLSSDFEFHLAVSRATENEFFETVLRMLSPSVEFTINLARSLSMSRPIEHQLTIQAEHVAIFESIEAHDGECARTIMRSHLENACKRIFEGGPIRPAVA
jgi:DNA-binding FadR family transcriptional regulator